MNEFYETLKSIGEESDAIQKKLLDLQTEQQLFNQKLGGFLKENGLPENFSIPQLALLVARKMNPTPSLIVP